MSPAQYRRLPDEVQELISEGLVDPDDKDELDVAIANSSLGRRKTKEEAAGLGSTEEHRLSCERDRTWTIKPKDEE